MKRIFWNCVAALAAGLCLRLFFAWKYPATAGDTVIYEQIAANWLKHHVYAMDVHGQVTPVDMRMPGYPAFLAIIYAITGRTAESARLGVMLAQVAVDLLTCLVVASLAALLLLLANERARPHRVFLTALWLAALCPFTANYTAVPLTEVFAIFFTAAALLGLACAIPLVPWTIRNAVTLHEFQLLAPKNSNLPGELVPYGFMSWEKTWLYRFRDVYLVPWKLNEEVLNVDAIPVRAFDTAEEKQRVAMILEQYNDDLALTPDEDAAFAQLARERTARHALRTYLVLPAARAIALWFTPRIELLPFSGTVFPLAQAWEDDPVDQSVTAGLFLLNIVYIALALCGAVRLWRRARPARAAIALLLVFILLRTAFLTTLETPEPRYVLVCFPALLALAAQVFAPSSELESQPSRGSG